MVCVDELIFVREMLHQTEFRLGSHSQAVNLSDDTAGGKIYRQSSDIARIYDGQAVDGIDAETMAKDFRKTHPRQDNEFHARCLGPLPQKSHGTFRYQRAARHRVNEMGRVFSPR